jgi:putative two-component system response regulator
MSKKILVVDDSETSLFLIQSIFDEDEGIDYELESDGQKALEKLIRNKPDLVILDLLMPHFSGYDFLEQAKAKAETRDIPIIVLTALQEDDAEKKAMDLGAMEYIRKPLDVEQLENTVNRYLE